MALWTAYDAAAATGGQAVGDWSVTGISIDTRSIVPGELFVALKDVRDGHDFVAQALEKGAGAALVSGIPEGVASDAPLLIVPDVLAALEDLGRAARARTKAKVIGVTGSAGKTTTKEMLRSCFSGQGHVHAAEKSFNNHWGVPLTLARMPCETDFAVIEIGMNHPGEISPLAKMSQLDVAIITLVAPAHLEAFENVEGIAREKATIFDGLVEGGVAILNGDLDVTDLLTRAAPGPKIRFGASEHADWRLTSAEIAAESTICQATHDGAPLIYKIGAPGKHLAMNALAALAAVEVFGGDLAKAVMALGQWHPPSGRGKRARIALDAVDARLAIDVIDDAYNANPASVGAALDLLSAATPPHAKGTRVVVLGDMKELGPSEAALHAGLSNHSAFETIGQVHCVGPLMRHLYDTLPDEKRGLWAETAQELAQSPSKLVQAGDVVLVKGSLSMKMAQIVDAITNLGQAVGE